MMASISTVSTVSVTEQQYPVLYHADYTIYSIFRLLTSTCGTSPPMVEYFSVLSGDDKTPGIEKGNPPPGGEGKIPLKPISAGWWDRWSASG